MRLVVMGTGYVGLVAGACFADTGHDVTCIDTDPLKIEALREGRLPIYEEGLGEIVARCVREGRLTFSVEAPAALASAEIVFCAVGTPPGPDGHADLESVFEVARAVARHAVGPTLLVLKSTVPVRTNQRVTGLLRELGPNGVEVVSNPEFMKEGAAVNDFRRPDRVVVGVRSARAGEVMRTLYEPFVRTGAPILVMDPASAELTKYAANAMLATRISFMNAIAQICEGVGADVDAVRRGVGSDRRIGSTFLFPGLGYGGSCFPKDVQALAATARELGRPFALLDEVERVNAAQKRVLVTKLERAFQPLGGLEGRTVALWGLAFKANTDDLREAPALVMIDELLSRGARVRAHDPVATERAREWLRGAAAEGLVTFATTMYEALEGADALAIATDWSEYRRPDFVRLRSALKRPWIFDGRNMWDAAKVGRLGLAYHSIGRPTALPELAEPALAPD
jgi:UDPglucose 6-dehydrogenase